LSSATNATASQVEGPPGANGRERESTFGDDKGGQKKGRGWEKGGGTGKARGKYPWERTLKEVGEGGVGEINTGDNLDCAKQKVLRVGAREGRSEGTARLDGPGVSGGPSGDGVTVR